MIKLGKRVEYGLTALLHLYKNAAEDLVNTHQLSSLYDIPEEHLGKVLQKLAKAGLLESVHGAHGGYRLKAKVADINLGRVIEAVEGADKLAPPCENEGHRECGNVCTCYAKAVVNVAHQHVTAHLYELTLDKLARTLKRSSPKPQPCQDDTGRPHLAHTP